MEIIKNMSQSQKDTKLNSQLFYFDAIKDAQIKVAAAQDALSFLQGVNVNDLTFTDKFLRDANITTRNNIADLRDAGAKIDSFMADLRGDAGAR